MDIFAKYFCPDYEEQKDIIEEYKTINGMNCYGTNYYDLIGLLTDYDYKPVMCEKRGDTWLQYFERIDEFDTDVEFFKDMLNGGLFPWLIMMNEKYNDDQMWLDCV